MDIQSEYDKVVDDLSKDMHGRLKSMHTLEKFYTIETDTHLESAIKKTKIALEAIDEWLVRKGMV